MNGPHDLVLKRERHERRMQLQSLRRLQSVPEANRNPVVLRSRLSVLRDHKNRLWADLELMMNNNSSEPLIQQCADTRKKEIAAVNRQMDQWRKYLDLLEGQGRVGEEQDPSMNQIL